MFSGSIDKADLFAVTFCFLDYLAFPLAVVLAENSDGFRVHRNPSSQELGEAGRAR